MSISSPNPASSSPRRGARSPRAHSVILFSCFALGLLAILLYMVLQFGNIEGQEFDAETFTRRQFSYLEIPLVSVQVSPVRRTFVTNDLESHLKNNQYLGSTTPSRASPRWDLVVAHHHSMSDAERLIAQGEARILCEYLDATDNDGNSIWLTWTQKEPELAQVVWPAVARVARQELYIFVPDLLAAARAATDPVHLQRDIDRLLTSKYLTTAQNERELGQHEFAVKLFTNAIEVDPQQTEALVGRAGSLASLGQHEKAAADLARVAELETKP